MKLSLFASAVSFLILASNVAAQTSTTVNLKPIQTLNCYKNVGNLTKMEEYDFASDGWCQRLCGLQNYPVMAMTAGSICYCGNIIPALDQVVPSSKCNSPCNGYNVTNCGGFGYWQVYLTGLTNDVKYAANGTSSSGSASSTPTVTKVAETVVVTNSSVPNSSGTNKIGIAVGVVVGIVAFCTLIGAIIFYMKRQKKRAIEEEHMRMEAQAAALAAEKSDAASSRTDQRLDPSNIFSHRRESIGSIADERDFSRRILQVCTLQIRRSTSLTSHRFAILIDSPLLHLLLERLFRYNLFLTGSVPSILCKHRGAPCYWQLCRS